MRKSFDGLCGIVQAEFARDIRDGDLYLFLNRRGDRIKAMYWDRDGIAIWMKRLERGTFEARSSVPWRAPGPATVAKTITAQSGQESDCD